MRRVNKSLSLFGDESDEDKKPDEPYAAECADLHNYLVSIFRRGWLLSTWETTYRPRIKKYGLESCKIAVDGFCASPWHMKTVPDKAPYLIFRNDREFETFLVAGQKLPKHQAEANRRAQEIMESEKEKKEARARKAGARFLKKYPRENARLKERLKTIEEQVNPQSFETWFSGLIYAGMEGNTVILWTANEFEIDWIKEHYAGMLDKALGRPVKLIAGEVK